MTRVWSGAALVVLAVAVVWFAPPLVFLAVAEAVLVLAFLEYRKLADAVGFHVPAVAGAVATVLTSVAVPVTRVVSGVDFGNGVALDAVLMSGLVVFGTLALTTWRGGPDAIGHAAATVFALLYLGLPIGALLAVRYIGGPRELFLLMLTVMVSDSAQYYTGRLFGRTPLAPAISPKKTVEGAAGGFVFGALLLAVAGHWWLPSLPIAIRAGLGATVVALGIAGDLFESMLKRSAGVKDSGRLIPGHGGVLDRIDALLFAAPIYYLVLKYV